MTASVHAIEHLLHTYAERIDAGDFAGVGDLFTHGRIEAAADTVVEGREAVQRLYEATTRRYDDGTPKTKHVVTNAIIDVDDDTGTATSRSCFTVMQATEVLPLQVIITGRYHDTFVVVDGVWCFDTRTMLIDQVGDLSQHLLIEL